VRRTGFSATDKKSPSQLQTFEPVSCLAQAPNRRRSAQQTLGLCEREAIRSHILSHVRALRRAAEVMEEALYL
jgi:hypothetical protein